MEPDDELELAFQARADRYHTFSNIHNTGGSHLIVGDVHQIIHHDVLSEAHQCHRTFKTSPYTSYKDRNPLRLRNTCTWVLEHSQYKAWRQGTSQPLLWISADPGCGKSVLSRSLVDQDLQHADDEVAICYFFFKDNQEQDNLCVALCALLHQLFSQQPHLLRHAIPAWQENGDTLQRESQELWKILRRAATDAAARPVICVLDALDECADGDRKSLIELLCTLPQQESRKDITKNTLRILVTSRPYESVERWFERTTRRWPQLRLHGENENEQIHTEINLVIHARVQGLVDELSLSDSNRQRLLDQLLEKRHRTYLWLYLVMEEIRQAYASSLHPDDETIPRLSATVEEAYERILQKIDAAQVENARRILLIVAGARRPLSIDELACALSALQAYDRDCCTLPPVDKHHLAKRVRQWCGLFVFIQDTRLFLIHQTAKDFLISNETQAQLHTTSWRSSLPLIAIDKVMASLCVAYIRTFGSEIAVQQRESQRDDQSVEQHDQRDTFLAYCSECWLSHLANLPNVRDQKLFDKSSGMFDTTGGVLNRWFPDYWRASTFTLDVPSLPPQHVMAYSGVLDLLQTYSSRDAFDVNARDSTGRTVLLWAVERGHEKMIDWLLGEGANVDAEGGNYGTALQAASAKGMGGVVRQLLDAGADVNVTGGQYGTALYAASEELHANVVEMLLTRGANPNLPGGECHSPLQAAAHGGHEGVVRMLIDAGAKINARGGLFGTALCAASHAGHMVIVRALLLAGARTTVHGRREGSALYVAAERGHVDVVKFLLEKGAQVNALGGTCNTALQAASFHGHVELVELLLSSGADVNIRGGQLRTAITAALRRDHQDIVQLLVSAGAVMPISS